MLKADFEPITNREDWIERIEVFDQDNELIDLSAAVIVLAVREQKTEQLKLLAQTADSTIVILGMGEFQFSFTVNQMRGMEVNKTYKVGCTVQRNGVTQQLLDGSVPVIDGVVP